MSDKIADVIAKVRKLLSLSEGNTNENEAKAAREAADRMIQAYRLTQAQLEAAGDLQSEPFVSRVVSRGGRRTAWREVLLSALCTHYGGAFFFSSGRSGGSYGQGAPGSKGVQAYYVTAREGDFAIIEYMFTYLCAQVDRLGRWHCGGQGVGKAVAWRMGCALGIASQFHDMRKIMRDQAQGATSSAIVLLDKREQEATAERNRLNPDLRVGAGIFGGREGAARAEGYVEGRKIEIKEGLGQGGKGPVGALGA